MSESAHPRAHAAPPGGRGQRATRAFGPRHGVVSGSAARAGAAPPAFHTPRGSRQPRLHLHPARKVRTRPTPSFSEKVPACETWPHSDRLTASPRQPAANAPNALRGGGRRRAEAGGGGRVRVWNSLPPGANPTFQHAAWGLVVVSIAKLPAGRGESVCGVFL